MIPVSVSASGYEDGLGRRTLEFDRETGVILRFVESIGDEVTRRAEVVEFVPDSSLPPTAFAFVFPTGTTMLY